MKSSRVCWRPGPSGFSRINKYTQNKLRVEAFGVPHSTNCFRRSWCRSRLPVRPTPSRRCNPDDEPCSQAHGLYHLVQHARWCVDVERGQLWTWRLRLHRPCNTWCGHQRFEFDRHYNCRGSLDCIVRRFVVPDLLDGEHWHGRGPGCVAGCLRLRQPSCDYHH